MSNEEEKEELILEAALDVFATHGFRGSTIDQIAEAAGMSKPNLLYYFRRKEDIHETLMQRLLDTWLAPLREFDNVGDPLTELRGYIRRKLEMARDYPRESRLFANEILQALGLRVFVPSVTACPGCGRTTSTTFQELAKQIDDYLRQQMPVWRKRYPGVENLKVAVMGCIVNGPGESKHADIGISLPGTGESPAAPVFIDGQKAMTLRGARIAQEFETIVTDYIERRFGEGAKKSA